MLNNVVRQTGQGDPRSLALSTSLCAFSVTLCVLTTKLAMQY
jgi:hypothetical protein